MVKHFVVKFVDVEGGVSYLSDKYSRFGFFKTENRDNAFLFGEETLNKTFPYILEKVNFTDDFQTKVCVVTFEYVGSSERDMTGFLHKLKKT